MIFRIAVVCSILWFLIVLVSIEPWEYHWDHLDDFIAIAVIPLVVFWGIWWIIKAGKKKRQ